MIFTTIHSFLDSPVIFFRYFFRGLLFITLTSAVSPRPDLVSFSLAEISIARSSQDDRRCGGKCFMPSQFDRLLMSLAVEYSRGFSLWHGTRLARRVFVLVDSLDMSVAIHQFDICNQA